MVTGPELFWRYATPCAALGYCGPDQPQDVLDQVAAGIDDAELRHLARGFEDAWPYLELIAGAAGVGDPLDSRVVEAYWIGSPLLDRVSPVLLSRSLEARFRSRAGRTWPYLMDAVQAGALPHYSFHVFGVYPWLGTFGPDQAPDLLQVLDQCRIRWGQVVATSAEHATVRSRPLRWDGRRLELGEPRTEEVAPGVDRFAPAAGLQVGDWCALQGDRICDELSPRRLRAIQTYTLRQLRVVNSVPYSVPAAVLS